MLPATEALSGSVEVPLSKVREPVAAAEGLTPEDKCGSCFPIRTGVKMLVVAFLVLGYSTQGQRCDPGRCPVSQNGAHGVRCLAEMGPVPGEKRI